MLVAFLSVVTCFLLLRLIPVLLHNAIPFIGFGFLDNAIMIAAVSHHALVCIKTVAECINESNQPASL